MAHKRRYEQNIFGIVWNWWQDPRQPRWWSLFHQPITREEPLVVGEKSPQMKNPSKFLLSANKWARTDTVLQQLQNKRTCPREDLSPEIEEIYCAKSESRIVPHMSCWRSYLWHGSSVLVSDCCVFVTPYSIIYLIENNIHFTYFNSYLISIQSIELLNEWLVHLYIGFMNPRTECINFWCLYKPCNQNMTNSFVFEINIFHENKLNIWSAFLLKIYSSLERKISWVFFFLL